MDLQLEQLCTDRLRLAVPNRRQPTTELELGPSGGLVGTYITDEQGHHLKDVSAAILRLGQLAVHLSAATIDLQGGEAVDAQVDLDILADAPLRGDLRAKRLKLPQVVVSSHAASDQPDSESASRSDIRAEGRMVIARPHVRLTGASSGQIEATARQIRSARLCITMGDVRVDFSDLSIRRISLFSSGGQLRLNLGAARARLVRLRSEGVDVTLHDVVLPKGLFASEEVLRISGGAKAARMTSALDGLANRSPKSESVDTSSAPFDLGFLDALQGRLKLDVAVDIKLPLIHMRHANHRIRLDVREGAVSYSQLEHSLETLEDAVINFRHEDDWLLLEKDIPLIPFDRRALVRWPLNGDEDQSLAEQKRVRLGLLSRYDIPTKRKEEAESDGAVQFKRLVLGNIQFELASTRPISWKRGATEVVLGGKRKGLFRRLTVEGSVGLDVGKPHEGALIIRAEDLRIRLPQLVLSSCDASVGFIRAAVVDEVRVQFEGLAPQSVGASMSAISIGPISARWKNRRAAKINHSDSQFASGSPSTQTNGDGKPVLRVVTEAGALMPS